MRWRRMAGAFPWRTAALVVGFLTLEWFWWWTWIAQELPPLERYYLPSYFLSTEGAKHSGSKTRIDPLFKTASGRKSEILLAPDVTPGRDGNLPLQLSQSALERGWIAIGKGRPFWDDSAAVEDLLREDFYQGHGLWELAAEPLAEGLSLLLLLVVVGLLYLRKELAAEWSGLWSALMDPDSTSDYQWDSPADRLGIRSLIGWRSNIRKLVEELRFRRVQPALQTSRLIDAKRDSDLIRGDIGEGRFSLPASMSRDSVPEQPDSIPQFRLEPPAIKLSKNPTKRRLIFPGRAGVRTSNQKPKPWDESHWIE